MQAMARAILNCKKGEGKHSDCNPLGNSTDAV